MTTVRPTAAKSAGCRHPHRGYAHIASPKAKSQIGTDTKKSDCHAGANSCCGACPERFRDCCSGRTFANCNASASFARAACSRRCLRRSASVKRRRRQLENVSGRENAPRAAYRDG